MMTVSLTVEFYSLLFFFFSSRRRHTRYWRDWSSDVCSSDLVFQADMLAAYDRISTGSHIMQTANGTLEYADLGNGNPVLVVHGAGGGYDQGLLLSEIFFGEDIDQFRLIAPSKIGRAHV